LSEGKIDKLNEDVKKMRSKIIDKLGNKKEVREL
jgi:hypothetical protein